MKKHLSNILLILAFLVGLSLLLYPTVSNYLAQKTQSKAIVGYQSVVGQMTQEDFAPLFEAADQYNQALNGLDHPLLYFDSVEGYDRLLNVRNDGMMGYINIEKLGVALPIYHSTEEAVLSKAVGHVQGSSLPVGGEGTHAVLSAHRGLPSAKLFTNLDEMELGDTFTITVLGRVLTYEVDQIRIVEPENTQDLLVEKGMDYCTLLTCTPYGINSHRLLVRGHRVETVSASHTRIIADATRIDPLIVAPLVAAPLLAVLFVVVLVRDRRKKKKQVRKF